MDDKILKLVAGSLLHDIGKIIHRAGEIKKHSQSGYDFISNELKIKDKEILEQVKYHHVSELNNAKIEDDSLAYITYIADNISSGVERRDKEEVEKAGFNKNMPLDSIFNLLNNSKDTKVYSPSLLKISEINYPREKDEVKYESYYYEELKRKLKENLKEVEVDTDYINSVLEIIEAYASYVPSSTSNKEVADISLYEHMKLTAAFSSAIYKYLKAENIYNYKDELLKNSKTFYDKKTFILLGLDISGIQNFIYTIVSKEALKGLRARSFYLEILLEHINDELLEKLGLTRSNILYSGGGHSYIILDNTEKTKTKLREYVQDVNRWFLDNYGINLYLSYGFAEASTYDFENIPNGSYGEIFRTISQNISFNKLSRYSPDEIIKLNSKNHKDSTRECSICKRSDNLTEEDICYSCDNLKKISNDIKRNDFLIILSKKPVENHVKLPNDRYLIIQNEKQLREYQKQDHYIRAYAKNEAYAGEKIATKIWVGDYNKKKENIELNFEDLVQKSQGIQRLGVIRADIDNLGQAFVSGFERENGDNIYSTITRTAVLSKRLSTFFKLHINEIVEKGEFFIEEKEDKSRNAIIVYSGGDDLLIVGSWDDILGLSIDIRNKFKKYTQNTLTISAGIGLFPNKYPISAMARETGELEDFSKSKEGKNAITLFSEEESLRFNWDELENDILGEKYSIVKSILKSSEERGNSYIYKILSLLREEEEINIARLAYQLARLEPKDNKEEYIESSKKFYKWAKNKKDKNQLITAIYIYVYMHRRSRK